MFRNICKLRQKLRNAKKGVLQTFKLLNGQIKVDLSSLLQIGHHNNRPRGGEGAATAAAGGEAAREQIKVF